ncbi:heme-binding protein [Shinella sp. S4-D37]|uniref:GlcG/HbpS family heme-binding protein n=1 Tax=Shinella sp. S4-D37 TaxID=3161999 RepID=UPI003466A46F
MAELTLAAANIIIAAALEAGTKAGFKPLTVAVLDAGGHLKAFQKQDGASMLRYEIAFGKAYGSLAVGMGSRWLDRNAKERPHFIEGLTAVSGGRIVAVPGGVLIRDAAGALLGAVGITGDTSDNDETCAVAGIEAAGLVAQVD